MKLKWRLFPALICVTLVVDSIQVVYPLYRIDRSKEPHKRTSRLSLSQRKQTKQNKQRAWDVLTPLVTINLCSSDSSAACTPEPTQLSPTKDTWTDFCSLAISNCSDPDNNNCTCIEEPPGPYSFSAVESNVLEKRSAPSPFTANRPKRMKI